MKKCLVTLYTLTDMLLFFLIFFPTRTAIGCLHSKRHAFMFSYSLSYVDTYRESFMFSHSLSYMDTYSTIDPIEVSL